MGKSFRIRTTPGDDKNISIQIEQDFEQLEILSLKIRQEEIYTRFCSDFGIVAGRVFANNGYGIPNAKLTIFIPLLREDENNPNITSVYPYKNLEQENEDGFRFNILPYSPQYEGHTPTGTFPTRHDVLNNENVGQLYDKYYRFTVTTNDSGDFMIYGVPVGTQTLVMNLDLSDMGEFSLTPRDLIRLGVASDKDFDGVKFKSSPNFRTLPQIIVINKTIEVVPFWGQEETCQIGITRSDFDITSEANINIQPVAVFMGSLMSSNERSGLKVNGVARRETGDLCKMSAGPGEIIALSQTSGCDSNGLPILERANLPESGKLIDEDGAWMFDLPMNLNYIYTDEFGNLVESPDPSIGVPTKGKYRFKIKWQQSENINEDFKRGYFLIPNIKEKGWDLTNSNTDPLSLPTNSIPYQMAQKSYAFSLDWSAYTMGSLSMSNPDISSAVNCEDTFYEFDFNQVYTVSQFVDNDKIHTFRERFLGIKRIEENTCEDTTNRYPVNDGVLHTSVTFIIFNVIFSVISFLLPSFILIYHVLRLISILLYTITYFVLCPLLWLLQIALFPIRKKIKKLREAIGCTDKFDIDKWLGPLKFPMISYPDCDMCDCSGVDSEDGSQTSSVSPPLPYTEPIVGDGAMATLGDADFYNTTVTQNFSTFIPTFSITDIDAVSTVLAQGGVVNEGGFRFYSDKLPFAERINSFNVKGKYFNDNNGVNQIQVTYEPSITTNSSISHFDNTLTFIISNVFLESFSSGTMFCFSDITNPSDPNITGATTNGWNTNNTTGATTYPSSVNIVYCDTSSRINNLTKQYSLPTNFTDVKMYTFPADVEYFQSITALTINQFLANTSSTPLDGSMGDILGGSIVITKTNGSSTFTSSVINLVDVIDPNEYSVIISQRGVDPYSPLYNTNVKLGRLFGFNSHGSVSITTDLRLNIPIRATIPNGELAFQHNLATTNADTNNGQNLFFDSYIFDPSANFISFTTTNHNYYSRLDTTLTTSPPPVFVTNPLSNWANNVIFNNTKDLVSKPTNRYYSNTLTENDSNYFQNESLVGGTYLYGDLLTDYKYSPIYPTTNTLTMSSGSKIVMRADRLPSSQVTEITNDNAQILQSNPDATILIVNESIFTSVNLSSTNQQYNNDYDPSFSADTVGIQSQVFDTFDCTNMKSLYCYSNFGSSLQIVPDGSYFGDCDYGSVRNGCYVFARVPIVDWFIPPGRDVRNLAEYLNRLKFFYQVCQGAVSLVFNNNWINGNLYAVPFKIQTFYNSRNRVSSRRFARRIVVLHDETNNFYYRSSPYDVTQGKFIGAPGISSYGRGANVRNLKTPTTIMNLGPKDALLSKTSLSANFEGYLANKLLPTTYNDTNDLLNYFIFMRVTNSNFLRVVAAGSSVSYAFPVIALVGLFTIFGGMSIRVLFGRPGTRIDGDFAQTTSINSQIGIVPFDGDVYNSGPILLNVNYPTIISAPQDPTFTNASKTILGVYYSSTTEDIQIRDLISRRRLIRINSVTNTFIYDYLNQKSQIVPHFKWNIDNGGTIFGKTTNNWSTNISDIVQNKKYQELDRFSSGYPVGQNLTDPNNYRGYIYSLDSNGNPNYSPNPVQPNPAMNGAPWHFYFGLTKGKSALDRFFKEYIGETNLNE